MTRCARLSLCAILLAACDKPAPPLPAPEDAGAAASARGVSDFPPDPAAPPPPKVIGPAPSASAVSREERERRVLDLLAGKLPATEVADEPADPGQSFDPLRRAIIRIPRRKDMRVTVGKATASGLAVEVVDRMAREHAAALRRCYERGLTMNPVLQGRVTVELAIDADGRVTSVKNAGSDVPDGRVVQCVMQSFERITLPRPESAPASAVIPVMFAPWI